MKRTAQRLSVVAGLVVATTAQAITLTTATVTENFDGYGATGPAASDWSTTALTAVPATGLFSGGAGGITDITTFDTQVSLLAATDMATALVVELIYLPLERIPFPVATTDRKSVV